MSADRESMANPLPLAPMTCPLQHCLLYHTHNAIPHPCPFEPYVSQITAAVRGCCCQSSSATATQQNDVHLVLPTRQVHISTLRGPRGLGPSFRGPSSRLLCRLSELIEPRMGLSGLSPYSQKGQPALLHLGNDGSSCAGSYQCLSCHGALILHRITDERMHARVMHACLIDYAWHA